MSREAGGERREACIGSRRKRHVLPTAMRLRYLHALVHSYPMEAVGRCPIDRRHHASRLTPLASRLTHHPTTQVSFVPPPCDEFTTSEPSFNATRVRPPGTITISLPERMKGRRSMWRGATPCSTK